MRFDGFFGGSYESQAVTADGERTVNWYPERLQSSGAPSRGVLYPTPGVEVITDYSSLAFGNGGRGHFVINGREFLVVGGGFLEIGSNGAVVNSSASGLSGTSNATNDGLPVTICSNGDAGGQLFIAANNNGYYVDLTAVTASPVRVTALDGKARFGGHLDGYFLALDTTTSTLYISNLLDGTTWDTGTDFAQRSLAPDRWLSMKVLGRAVWLFGEQTTEVWFDTGARFPLAPHPGGVMNYGIMAPYSVETIGDSIYWLGTSRDGKVCVLRASEFQPEVISTYPLETKMQDYLSLTSAVADSYADSGHSFYLLNFDRDNVTWAYDIETGIWSERGTWTPESNRYVSWRPRFYAYAFNEHRILDTSNCNLYRMSSSLVRDVDGRLIRRMRRAPGLVEENKRVFYNSFELDLEPGLGEDHGHVSFRMHATVTTVSGTITDDDGDPVEGATVTVTVDGDAVGTTTTDENGEYEVPGAHDGTVTVIVEGIADGISQCGMDTGVATGPGPGVLTSPGVLILDIQLMACLAATFTAVATQPVQAESGLLTLTPTLLGGSGTVTYAWSAWTEHGGAEDTPAFTDTDEIGIWQPLYAEGSAPICFGEAKLVVTDTVTGQVVTVGPQAWTWGYP